jgi:aminopeptidase N
VREFSEEWLASVMNLGQGGRDTYERDLDRYILPALGGLKLKDLTTKLIDDFLSAEPELGLAPSSVHRHYRVIHRLVEVAIDGVSADELARAAWYRVSRLAQDLVVADPGPELMFDDRLYKRGALALHALRPTLGSESFFDMLRAWVADHRYGSVTTEDFIEHIARRDAHCAALLTSWLWRRELSPLPPVAA